MLKIGICEDELKHQQILEGLISQQFNNQSVCVNIYSRGTDLIEAYKNGKRLDMLFLDVMLNDENGIDIGGYIHRVDPNVSIILVTSIIEAAMEGYSIGVKEFLLKPIDEDKFKTVVTKIVNEKKEENKQKYIIENRMEKIYLDIIDIKYIESSGRKLIVYAKDHIYEHYRSLSQAEEELRKNGFVKPHRSYLVNMNYIHRIKREEILLKDQTRIPLTVKNRDLIYDEYARYLTEALK